MFIGREKELRVLENEYNKKGFSMTILYGRRRIGKSTLLLEFIKRKNYERRENSRNIFRGRKCKCS